MAEGEDRHVGSVLSVKGEYGFIRSTTIVDKSIYFKQEWVLGEPLQGGEEVSFLLQEYPNAKVVARQITRVDLSATVGVPLMPSAAPDHSALLRTSNTLDPDPGGKQFLQWASLGYLPKTLTDLRDRALSERWEFRNQPTDPVRPLPILFRYLVHTFGRLSLEKKILINDEMTFAAFNTGLVDRLYEPLYALFEHNTRQYPWRLSDLCTASEGRSGLNLMRNFRTPPGQAHYFDDPSDLIYDVRAGTPSADWRHIIVENISRFPPEFIEDNRPSGFALQDTRGMSDDERNNYFERLGQAIEDSDRSYRLYKQAVEDAVKLAIKRVSWNFKTAIPQYYPRVRKLQLLLPMCLVSDEKVDLALAVEKTGVGTYIGHTILHLDWAYSNARLICRPDSDWLDPVVIDQGAEEDSADD